MNLRQRVNIKKCNSLFNMYGLCMGYKTEAAHMLFLSQWVPGWGRQAAQPALVSDC